MKDESYAKEEEGLLLRLRKIEGQVKGLQRMIEEGRQCEEIITQLMAARSSLDQVGLTILDCQIRQCLGHGPQLDSDKLQRLHQTIRLWTRYAPTGSLDAASPPTEEEGPGT